MTRRRQRPTEPVLSKHPEQIDERRTDLGQEADYLTGPEDARSGADEVTGDRTGTARRAEEAAGQRSDENNMADAERALRRSGGMNRTHGS